MREWEGTSEFRAGLYCGRRWLAIGGKSLAEWELEKARRANEEDEGYLSGIEAAIEEVA